MWGGDTSARKQIILTTWSTRLKIRRCDFSEQREGVGFAHMTCYFCV